MGRPLNKKFFANRNLAGVNGEFLSSITTASGANNSSGFTNGSATQVTLSAPQVAGGVTATVTVQSIAGAILQLTAGNGSGTTLSGAGTAVAVTQTFTGLTQKSTSGSGTGAVFTVARTGGTSYASNTTVTCTSAGAGYANSATIVIDGSLLGGVTSTNDLTITLGTVATAGQITGLTITNPGSGYTSAPTPTYSTGTIGTLAFTFNLASTQEDAVVCQGITSGSTNRTSGNDIIKQVSTRRYKIQTQDGTAICTLKASAPSAAGEMAIVATDASSGTYYVTKLTKNKATLTRGTGTVYTDGAQVPWTFGTADANTCKIPSA